MPENIDKKNNITVQKCTDIVKITKNGIWVLSSFPVHFESVFQHEDRLICDNFVYSM